MELLQLEKVILEKLCKIYPDGMMSEEIAEGLENEEAEIFQALYTLYEEGLIAATISNSFDHEPRVIRAEATAKGKKVIRGDKEFITVKLHQETIDALRSIFIEAIAQASLPEKEKSLLEKFAKTASTASINESIKIAVTAGFARAPEIYEQIYALLRSSF